jgi:hypothetical protein
VAGLVADGRKTVDRVQAGRAADHLDFLAFHPGGFCKALRQIASGQGSEANIDELQQMLDSSAEDVQRRVYALHAYRDTVRRNCGADAGIQMAHILDGPEGKFQIRYDIMGLVQMARSGSSLAAQKSHAENILKSISKFNDEYVKLHDLIFPPRGAPR